MLRNILLVTIGTVLLLSCSKSNNADESIFYGTWVKGTSKGDTLWFYKKDGKNIMAFNPSVSPGPLPSGEIEYSYNNNKLHLHNHWGVGDFTVQSFTWKQYKKEFEVQGSELFLFMSSTLVHFTYKKVQ